MTGMTAATAVRQARTRLTRLLPAAADYRDLRASWKGDVLAGVTVGVVALPLALAFGISSGVGAAAGLITAVIAGLVAAVFGGSHVQVSGPTGAMAVILAPIVAIACLAWPVLVKTAMSVQRLLGVSAIVGLMLLSIPLWLSLIHI